MGQGDFLAYGQNCEFQAIVTSKICLPGNVGIKQKEWLISQGGNDLGEVLDGAGQPLAMITEIPCFISQAHHLGKSCTISVQLQ